MFVTGARPTDVRRRSPNHGRRKIAGLLSSAASLVVLAGCAGSSAVTPRQSLPASPGSLPATSKAAASVRITIPSRSSTAGARRAQYVSPATQSIAVSFTPTPSGSVQTFNQNLTAGSPGCTASLVSPLICTVQFALAPGNYTATFATYDGLLDGGGNPTGNVLSQNQSLPVTIAAGQANNINATLQGVPATVAFIPGPASTLNRTATASYALSKCFANQSVTVIGLDADGNYILGPGAPVPALTSSDPTQVAVAAPTAAAPNIFTLSRPTAPNANATITLTGSVTPGSGGGAAVQSGVNVSFDAAICQTYTVYTLPTAFANPRGIAVAQNGDVWFTENNSRKIGKLSGGTITEYAGGLQLPMKIAIGPDNAVWFTGGNGGIGRVSMADGSATTYGTTGYPNDITSGPDGALWFTDYLAFSSQAIGRITTGGALSYFPTPVVSNSLLMGITAAADGALWFVDIGTHQIGRITTSGSLTEYPVPFSVQAFYDADTIVTGADGALWFTAGNANEIIRTTLSGVSTAFTPTPSYALPHSAALGSDKAIWFIAAGIQSLGRIDVNGNIQEFAQNPSSSPSYIASSPDGSLWYTDQGRNAIIRVQ